MSAGIRDILIISTPSELPRFRCLLGEGEKFGINLHYAEQSSPNGIAEAFLIGETFISNDSCALILGDNIFFRGGLSLLLKSVVNIKRGATIFAYHVDNPERYGVIEFDKDMNPVAIIEKPKRPRSHYAVTGLYFYDNNVCDFTKALKPSLRNELEITDLNCKYLENNLLNVEVLGRGYSWLDVGTQENLLDASNFVNSILEKAKSHSEIKVVNDQVSSPTSAIDLAKLLTSIIETDKYGIYHVTNEGFCSWYDFAYAIFKIKGINMKIIPIMSEEHQFLAKRPKNSRLSKRQLSNAGFNGLPTWYTAISLFLKQTDCS
jgi:glucose-1-phosphate thymidylyltransferase short form